MGWDQRYRYFYINEWLDGRSVRRYLGCGPVAELAATLHAQNRLRKESEARELKAFQERVAEAAVPLRELGRVSDLLGRAALLAAGFHNPSRNGWRKRRAQHQEQGP